MSVRHHATFELKIFVFINIRSYYIPFDDESRNWEPHSYLYAKYKACRHISTVTTKSNFKIQIFIFMLRNIDNIVSLKFISDQFFL